MLSDACIVSNNIHVALMLNEQRMILQYLMHIMCILDRVLSGHHDLIHEVASYLSEDDMMALLPPIERSYYFIEIWQTLLKLFFASRYFQTFHIT